MLLGQALALLPLNGLALALLGFQRWTRIAARLAPVEPVLSVKPQAARQGDAVSVARLVDAAARHGLYHATCLPRSLTLWWLLRRRGIDAELRIGVNKQDRRLEAHAWVEWQGIALNEAETTRGHFLAFDRDVVPGKGLLS